MPLAAGMRLGPYEILAPLGAGGMGEVYRARDSKLGRDVAIKVLPRDLAGNPAALGRFEREARAVAALSHPNILSIYDFGASDGVTYAVTELLAGETLRQRLARDRLPQKRSVEIARGVALGLAAAHERGIVHRDLKPDNLFLTKDGGVKILDFGLAKLVLAPEEKPAETVTDQTEAGAVLGTVGYMSPEQVRGETADHRSDIFSFGTVLYEMLAGRRAFKGETSVETMHAILKEDSSWEDVPQIPPPLQRILAHCLEKSPADRFQSARDLAFDLDALSTSSPALPAPRRAPSRSRRLMAALGTAAVAAVVWLALRRPEPARTPLTVHATIPLPPGVTMAFPLGHPDLAISPDGRTIVFCAARDNTCRLYRRPLQSAEAVVIPGTDDAYGPFFSPDGQWIGFFAGGQLKKVPLTGGAAVSLARVPPNNPGATWGNDGRIVYTRSPVGELFWVPETGGEPRQLTRLEETSGDKAHLYPQFVPGTSALLFTVRQGRDFQDLDRSSIALLETKTGKRRILLEDARFARCGGDRLVFLRGDKVFSVAFDAQRLETTGAVTPLGEPISTNPATAVAYLDISPDGALVFLDGPPIAETITKVLRLDRTGKERIVPLPRGLYNSPRLSPDGRQLALVRGVDARFEEVVFDLHREVLTTLTPEPGRYAHGVWSNDGSLLAFSSFLLRPPAVAVKRFDATGGVQILTRPSVDAEFPESWSPDGTTIAYSKIHTREAERDKSLEAFSSDIWLVGSDGKMAERPWFETPSREMQAEFSPDGKWIAYVSNESGSNEVFIRSYPAPVTRIKISGESGIEPTWARGGRELIYRAGPDAERFFFVAVALSPTPTVSAPQLLFKSELLADVGSFDGRQYDVSRDGKEIFGVREDYAPEPERRLEVVTDWASTQPH